jgi:hypothetical protein
VQLRFDCPLTSEEYVSRQAWREARLESCPAHRQGGCGFARHSTYGRKWPPGTRIARWYCQAAHQTFSLLPDFLAAHLPGTLDEVERVVAAVEAAPSVERAADSLRPEVELPGAVRWTRRRLAAVRGALVTIIGLYPDRLVGSAPRIAALRTRLGVERLLVFLRELSCLHLHSLPAPLGFGPRLRRRRRARKACQQRMGPDPPR